MVRYSDGRARHYNVINEHGTGVLCPANDRQAYGIPMSFAYEGDRIIMDLDFAEESKKPEFIETTDEVCLTVYEWDGPHEWTSVVVTGPLERLSEAEIDDDLEGWYYRVATDIDIQEGSYTTYSYDNLESSLLSVRDTRSVS